MQWHTLTHKPATGPPLSPQPRVRPVLLRNTGAVWHFLWRFGGGVQTVRKAKFAEIEIFERKTTGARPGARHVSWELCQLAAHTRVGRSVGQ